MRSLTCDLKVKALKKAVLGFCIKDTATNKHVSDEELNIIIFLINRDDISEMEKVWADAESKWANGNTSLSCSLSQVRAGLA